MVQDEKKQSVDSLIDANLRRVYADVLQEEVPDRFTALLDQLRSGEVGADGAFDDDEADEGDPTAEEGARADGSDS